MKDVVGDGRPKAVMAAWFFFLTWETDDCSRPPFSLAICRLSCACVVTDFGRILKVSSWKVVDLNLQSSMGNRIIGDLCFAGCYCVSKLQDLY